MIGAGGRPAGTKQMGMGERGAPAWWGKEMRGEGGMGRQEAR